MVGLMLLALAAPAQASVIEGSYGDDNLDGSSNGDQIMAKAGNDVVNARGGSDEVHAGAGDDSVNGGAGSDMLAGKSGHDTLYGGTGADSLYGGKGDDHAVGGPGKDRLILGSGNDTAEYTVEDNLGKKDVYNAGKGSGDTLVIKIDSETMTTLGVTVEDIEDHFALGGDRVEFATLGFNLVAKRFESLQVIAPPPPPPPGASAVDDEYDSLGNVGIDVADPGAGLLANDDPGAMVDTYDAMSAAGGEVMVNADGTFSYRPPAGFRGVDTFTYSIGSGTGGDIGAVVTIDVGLVIWFIDQAAPAGGDGRLAGPFDSVGAFRTEANDQPNDIIYIATSTDPYLDAHLSLQNGQLLLGGEVDLVADIGVLAPPFSLPLPPPGVDGTELRTELATGSMIELADSNLVRGLVLSPASTGGAVSAISGSSAGGDTSITDVVIYLDDQIGGVSLTNQSGTLSYTGIVLSAVPTAGNAVQINGGSAAVTFDGIINYEAGGAAVDVLGGNTGSFDFNGISNVHDGTGLQFANADGTYSFTGIIDLDGGDAGIDILNGSSGTFTFGSGVDIVNPTGPAVNIQSLASGAVFNYDGDIVANSNVILSVDTAASGSVINFNKAAFNTLTSTGNPFGGIFLFDIDGNLEITTPTTITDPGFSSLFATDGDGVWTFNDLTINGQAGLNGGVDIFGQTNIVNFNNLNITTNSAGTGDATTGFLAGGNNTINVTGNSSVNADGGGALVLINVTNINMTFSSLTSTNNLNSQVGFAGDDGIQLLNVDGGTLDVTGLSTVHNADGVGINIEDVGAAVTFASVDIDGIGLNAVIAGVVFSNTGAVNIEGGSINDVGADGIRLGSATPTSAVFTLNNVTMTNIGGFNVTTGNSTLSGSGNAAAPFSCNDLGGNTGTILFNGGVDSCP